MRNDYNLGHYGHFENGKNCPAISLAGSLVKPRMIIYDKKRILQFLEEWTSCLEIICFQIRLHISVDFSGYFSAIQ